MLLRQLDACRVRRVELVDPREPPEILVRGLGVDREPAARIEAGAGGQRGLAEARELETDRAADRHAVVGDVEQRPGRDVGVGIEQLDVRRQLADVLTNGDVLVELAAHVVALALPDVRGMQLDDPVHVVIRTRGTRPTRRTTPPGRRTGRGRRTCSRPRGRARRSPRSFFAGRARACARSPRAAAAASSPGSTERGTSLAVVSTCELLLSSASRSGVHSSCTNALPRRIRERARVDRLRLGRVALEDHRVVLEPAHELDDVQAAQPSAMSHSGPWSA